ncbi:MAG: flagellar basal body P-ring protein FlgI [Myxococcales bacterium]
MRTVRMFAAFFALAMVVMGARPARADRLRDMCDVIGVRDNQLLGYSVVTGLQSTGDDISAPIAMQSLVALMRRLGVQVDPKALRLRNVAAVLVIATLPPFARNGARLDVNVSSIGNARSLAGGVLVQTLLYGADSNVYAVAQGPLVLGGFEAKGGSGSSVKAGGDERSEGAIGGAGGARGGDNVCAKRRSDVVATRCGFQDSAAGSDGD